jgi:nucleoside-diphosphate-sugar epimerase
MAKIVITGGAGFIGSQLGKSLVDDGHDVLLLDNMSYGYLDNLVIDGETFGRFLGVDVCSPDLAKHLAGAQFVFHFAGISALPVCQEKPQYAMNVNVGGTANVLEAARLAGVRRLIFASTAAIYENNTKFPTKESDPVAPSLTYAVSKLQAEQLCRAYGELYGLEIVVLRYFNVYGPHQDFMRLSPPLMSYLIRELLADRQPVLHSDGTQQRDCIFVDDVNHLNKICMEHPRAPGEIFNVGSGVATSVREVFALIAKAMGSRITPAYRPATNFWDAYPQLFQGEYPLKGEVVEREVRKYSLCDTTKARELLGWHAKVSIDEGLAQTARYAMKLAGKPGPGK